MVARKISTPTLKTVLQTALSFDDAVFPEIELLLQSKETLEPSDAELERICGKFELDVVDLRYFVAFVTYLYLQLEGLSEADVLPTVQELLEQNEIEDESGKFASQLVSLLGYRQQHDKAAKRDRLVKGFFPFLVSTSSFVDRRADFGRKEDGELNGKIDSYVTVAQLSLLTDSPKESERQFVVQLDKNATEQLLRTLEDILEKIKVVESDI